MGISIIILIIILIISIIFCIPVLINRSINNKIIKNCNNFSDINNALFNTGDLLLYRWNYTIGDFDKNNSFSFNNNISLMNILASLVNSYINNIQFIHVGMIVIYNTKPYVLELNVSDLYDEYEKKIQLYKPTLVSIDHIYDYYGIVGYFPYIGVPIKKDLVNSILSEKNKYIHVRHSLRTALDNMKYYIANNNIYCEDININDSSSECPKYVNCLQYIIIVLKKLGIFDKNVNYLTMTSQDIYNECNNGNKYGEFTILINKYLSNYYSWT